MCFLNDGEPSAIWEEDEVKARKVHHCTECPATVQPGELYVRIASLYDGYWSHFVICSDCIYRRALVYAQERSEGCRPYESWPAVGDGEDVREFFVNHGWRLPGFNTEWVSREKGDLCKVVRWQDIDMAA